MKRLVIFVVAVLILSVAQAKAQQPTFAQVGTPCSTTQIYGNAQWCFDGINAATHNVYYNNGTGWTILPNTGVTPSLTSLTVTGSADKTVNISNGGHLSNPIGTGVAPTTGTGTVVAGGTDTAMRVTGGSSPVTVTFGTAFAVAPVCVCSNGSTAAHGCATSSEGTTSVVVTTASTDTFSLICFGK